ncbi:MAG: phosphodiester glycosidase family protein [Lachnospiraceae bacterium]|nr:phosphodiester glycosidase family protein [Lachnospiraceae bacterium]
MKSLEERAGKTEYTGKTEYNRRLQAGERRKTDLTRKGRAFGIAYGILLTAFTLYVVLDTFVITRVYQEAVVSSVTVERSGGTVNTGTLAGAVLISDRMYQDENISVVLTEYEAYDTTIYVADVVVTSDEYLKTAMAKNAYGKNVTAKTSETAELFDAILAINGDYYGAREKGYVIRNGVLYRSTAVKNQEDLVIYADGSFAIINESEVSAEQLLADGAMQVLSFGPALVIDGAISVTTEEEVGRAKASNPRTAIGMIEDGHYVFVVSDGRTDESEGLSLYQLAEFMSSLGVTTAYNLDGGGSSTMYFNGTVINNPTTTGNSVKERKVSDIVYIGY